MIGISLRNILNIFYHLDFKVVVLMKKNKKPHKFF